MEPRRSAEIRYIQPDVPQVERPAYRGRRYPAQVPDTLDLQEMAALAVNGLTGPTDADADYEIYWRAAFNTNPPVMWHAESDIVQGKFMEALPLMRLASGSSRNEQVAEGALVALQFPIDLSTEWIDVEKRTYRVLLRGNTCVAIDPPGRNVPLFRRDHYLGETRWRRTERFVPDDEVVW